MRRAVKLIAGGLCVCSLNGCAVGPSFHRPAAPAVDTYLPEPPPAQTASAPGIAGASQRFVAGEAVRSQWWHAFGSAPLDALVDEALRANPNVKVAQASLREALEQAAAQRGGYFPQLQANFDASRQRNAVQVLSPTLTAGTQYFSLYTPQLLVSFVPDLFGANRRQVESLVASADAARFERDATYLTLVNNVIATAIQVAGLREQVKATEQIVSLDSETLEVLHRSLKLGAVSDADVAVQETALAQAQASLPPLRHQLEQQRHQLAALTGHLPADATPFGIELSALQLPTEIPLGVPSKLVEHRPDILAAEAQLHAATAQVGVAEANLFPQLTITGGLGSTATRAADLFKGYTGFWNIGGSLTQTLFAGGSLIHRKRAVDAALDAAGETYRAVVLAAFQNVADALHALSTDAEVLAASVRAAQASESSYRIAQRQLELGSINYLGLVVIEQTYQQTQIAVIEAQMNRLADTAAFYQALGGAEVDPKEN